jgi:hypothetical protein
MKWTAVVQPHWRLLIALSVLTAAFYLVFHTGPFWTTVAALIAASTLFWMKLKYRLIYGVLEIAAGIFVLAQNYLQGRGDFSPGFGPGFQIFRWQVVLIFTLTAIYIMVRGIDNIFEALKAKK